MTVSRSWSVFPWRYGNSAQLLIDGEQFFAAMLDAIRQAKNTVLFEMYLVESGTIADRFIDALLFARQKGVTVLVHFDAYGSLELKRRDRKHLVKNGIKLKFYNPLRINKFKKNLYRTHRKILVIDGNTGFTGGFGISDRFMGNNAWRETVIKVSGPVVSDWQTLFLSAFYVQSDRGINTRINTRTHTKIDLADNLKEEVNPVQPLNRTGIKARVSSSDGSRHKEIKRVLLNRVAKSRQRVWLSTAYFIPSRKLRKVLRKAARKNIDVRLILPGPVTDHPAVRFASHRYYSRLLRHGVRIYEYQKRFSHNKVVLIDDWISIGSSNFDRWNIKWNLEAIQEINNRQLSEEVKRMFEIDFLNSEEIKYDSWKKRTRLLRFKEWFWGKIDLMITR